MIILTNCLSDLNDEGGIKVAQKIVTGIRQYCVETKLYTYEGEYSQSNRNLKLNKLMLNLRLANILHRSKENLLYAPKFARMLPMSLRALVLSIYVRGKVNILLPMCFPPGRLARILLALSNARLFVLSHDAYEMMCRETDNEVHYIRAGVDTSRFLPVNEERKKELKRKYGVSEDRKIVLHVGHLTTGRNVGTMLQLSEQYRTVMVTSTQTRNVWDRELSEHMQSESTSIRVIDEYIPKIEEIYQLADVYFFPVLMAGCCIDSPLSVFEAAACNLPIVCTEFGELKQLKGKDGFFFIDSFEASRLNELVDKALQSNANTRACVEEYDWDNAVKKVIQIVQESNSKG